MERKFGPISFIPGANAGAYPNSHSLYVAGDFKILVDAGADRGRLKELLDGPGVDAVWLSHYHEDHIMNLDLFLERELWTSSIEAPAMRDLDYLLELTGSLEEEKEFWGEMMKTQFNYKPRPVNRALEDGEVINLGGVTAEVVLTPGHTIGHLCFYFPDQEVLFLGDYDLTAFGPYYGDRDSDIDDVIASVNRLRDIPARVWATSHNHGLYTSDPGEAWDHYLKVIDEREEKLTDFLKEPRTVADIINARIVYQKVREPRSFFDFGERVIMLKHVERLMRQGAVVREGDTYRMV